VPIERDSDDEGERGSDGYLEVTTDEGSARRAAPAAGPVGEAYLETSALPDAPEEPSPVGRRKVRADDREPLVDDGAWDAVMGALVADRPFLLALWPDANPVEQLLSPPAAEAMMRRCEEAMRAVDAMGRRHDEARARADVAHRALRRYIDAFATDRYRQRDKVIAELDGVMLARMLEVIHALAGSAMTLGAAESRRLREIADTYGITPGRARDAIGAAGITFVLEETLPRAVSMPAPAPTPSPAPAPPPPAAAPVTPPEPAVRPTTKYRPTKASWHFEHLGADYFLPIVVAHRASPLPPLVAIWTGRTGVAYDEKAYGRQVNPNWMIELADGTTYTKRGGLSTPDSYTRSQMYRWEWTEIVARFGALTPAASAAPPAAAVREGGWTFRASDGVRATEAVAVLELLHDQQKKPGRAPAPAPAPAAPAEGNAWVLIVIAFVAFCCFVFRK
jgi:hypothetical protein